MASNTQTLKQVMTDIKNEIKILTQKILLENGLHENDKIVKQVVIKPTKDTLEVYLNSYIKFIQTGRGKFKTRVPIASLIRFIKKRQIPLGGEKISRVAYAIQTAIFKNGIKGKPGIEDEIVDNVGDYITDYIIRTFDIDIEENVAITKRKGQ